MVLPDSVKLKKPVYCTGAVLILMSVLAILAFERAAAQSPLSAKLGRPGGELFGLACHWEDRILGPEQIGRRYYAEDINGEREICIGESFGIQIDDYACDLDCDGIAELICNCVYGGDGAFRVMIYRLRNGIAEVGRIREGDLKLPGFQNWGANAIKEFYDPSTGCVIMEYASENGTCFVTCSYTDFEFAPFEASPWEEWFDTADNEIIETGSTQPATR